MEDFLNIKLSNNIDKDMLYNLFKSKKSDVNMELFSKLFKFNSNMDFFNFYSGIDLNPLLNNINKIKLGLTSILLIRSPEENESYFSTLSKIIISLHLINELNKITNDSLIQIQKYSQNFFIKNNVNQKLKSEIRICIHDLHSKNIFRQNDKKEVISDNDNNAIFTPKFEGFEPNKRFASSNSIHTISKKDSKEKLNKNIRDNMYDSYRNLMDPIKKKHKKKPANSNKSDNLGIIINDMNDLNFSFGEIPKKRIKKSKSKFNKKTKSLDLDETIKIGSTEKESKLLSSKQVYYDMYFNLLQIIKESYQKGLINAEEKLSLKKIIISKTEFIFDIYQKYHLNAFIKDKNNMQQLLNEMKKFLIQNNL